MKEKIADYEIICAKGNDSPYHHVLSERVRQMMEKGWQPYGSPYEGGDGMYQAMVKFADE